MALLGDFVFNLALFVESSTDFFTKFQLKNEPLSCAFTTEEKNNVEERMKAAIRLFILKINEKENVKFWGGLPLIQRP